MLAFIEFKPFCLLYVFWTFDEYKKLQFFGVLFCIGVKPGIHIKGRTEDEGIWQDGAENVWI
jgi:hypothetical protein